MPLDFSNVPNILHDQLNAALFQTALANLNWSRGYSWFVELDGVPSPFQRGGVLGLPVTNVTFSLVDGQEIDWESGGQTLHAPKGRSGEELITLELLDDEQQTMFTFFERWYNNVYNPYQGTLPLDEACKAITIYKLKSTRNKLRQQVTTPDITSGFKDYTHTLTEVVGGDKGSKFSILDATTEISGNSKTVTGREFYVYPYGTFQQSLDNAKNEPMSFTVQLRIALQVDADFGDPGKVSSPSILGLDTSGTFLEKIANYI